MSTDLFVLVIDLLLSSLLINKRISMCSHSHFFSCIRDIYPHEHPWFYQRVQSFLLGFGWDSTVRAWMIDFREIFKTYFESSVIGADWNESHFIHCCLMIEMFKDICNVDPLAYKTAYGTVHERLFNWGSSYGRAKQCWLHFKLSIRAEINGVY